MSAIKHNVADILLMCPSGKMEVVEFDVCETLSQIFTVRVLFKTDKVIAPGDLMDKPAHVELMAGAELKDTRKFHGVVSRFMQKRTGHGNLDTASTKVYFYEIELKPEVWVLSKVVRSMVYQYDDVGQVIESVFSELGFANYNWDVQGKLRKREYVIQYRESCLDFVMRLMEDEGIFFYFDHDDNGKMLIGDHSGLHKDCTPTSKATYAEESSPRFAFGKREFISDVDYEENVESGKVVINDYNPDTPSTDLKNDKTYGSTCVFDKYEVYHHQQHFLDSGEGATTAQIRLDELVTNSVFLNGTTTCRSFACGKTFTLEKHFNDALNKKWILFETAISGIQGRYLCHFRAVPTDVVFRPRRVTPKPKVYGIQTGVVTGPSGEKVYHDNQGRVKVQMHWDREGKRDEKTSMWIRVSNGYAGKNYGIQWIPRIGHEVLVSFVDGDPDRPIITGRVYHEENKPPLQGPPKKWQNIIKTIKDNHILFDDEDNKELLDIRAQKNMNTLVLNDKTITVGHDRTLKVGNDNTETVKKNKTVTVEEGEFQTYVDKGYYFQRIKSFKHVNIEEGDHVIVVDQGNYELKVSTGKYIEEVQAKKDVTVKDSYNVKVTNDQTFKNKKMTISNGTGGIKATSAQNIETSATQQIKISGNQKVSIKSMASSVTLEPAQIKLQIGGSSITLNAAGIDISAPMVTINGQATVTLNGLIKHNC